MNKKTIRAVMQALGRKGGKIGGKRRLETMSDAERRERAYKAARARWGAPCAYCGKGKLQCKCGRWGKKKP